MHRRNQIQMGKAISIIAKARAAEYIMHADVDAYYAPSECHELVSRGEERRERQARRHAKSISGLSRRGFNRRFKMVSDRTMCIVVDRIIDRVFPFYE